MDTHVHNASGPSSISYFTDAQTDQPVSFQLCSENHSAVVEYLIRNPDVYPSQRATDGQTPLHWACKYVNSVIMSVHIALSN